MSKLIVKLNEVNRPVCACSECQMYVSAPPNDVKYNFCYNCGAKFDRPVSALRIKRAKLYYTLKKKS